MVMIERQLGAWLTGDFAYVAHSDWVPMDEISPYMALAVMAAEDQKFPDHWGLMSVPSNQRCPIISAIKSVSVVHQRCHNKQLKTCFFGMAVAGYAKGWKSD